MGYCFSALIDRNFGENMYFSGVGVIVPITGTIDFVGWLWIIFGGLAITLGLLVSPAFKNGAFGQHLFEKRYKRKWDKDKFSVAELEEARIMRLRSRFNFAYMSLVEPCCTKEAIAPERVLADGRVFCKNCGKDFKGSNAATISGFFAEQKAIKEEFEAKKAKAKK